MSDRDQRPVGDEHALSGSYALDAVDAEERARYERALLESDQLREEAAGFADTAALLGSSVPPVTPPPALKASIMAQLSGLSQLPARTAGGAHAADAEVDAVPSAEPATAPDAADSSAAPTLAAVPSAPGAPIDPISPAAPPVGRAEAAAQRRWFSRPGAFIAAAAAALVLIAAVVVGVNWPGPNGWGAQRDLASISAASDAQQATGEVSGGGTVTLTWSEELGRSAVTVDGMPALDSDQTYELWYIDSEAAIPAGTFTVGDDGTTWRVLEGDMTAGAAVGVTVEPAGGSPQPTTEPVVVVPTAV
ncbi:anti-sigma factor [Leifsonia sp. YIM 134122]|uniref:Regulator of SigK n=1 Tax=Leifsonia stereocauli TaxID=3134136 RepID=A0ABU9W8C0_9MICO